MHYIHVYVAVIIQPLPSFLPMTCIRESVDSLCRDGADMPRPPYIGKACTRPNLEDLSLFRYLTFFGGCGRLLHALNHTLQWLLVSTGFGTVSSLHLISFLMIFTLVHI